MHYLFNFKNSSPNLLLSYNTDYIHVVIMMAITQIILLSTNVTVIFLIKIYMLILSMRLLYYH
jgi:hypothetical protein